MKAFPCKAYLQDKQGIIGTSEQAGMDLRDYFAAKVLSGIYSIELGQPNFKTIAEDAYKQADAMMKAREV